MLSPSVYGCVENGHVLTKFNNMRTMDRLLEASGRDTPSPSPSRDQHFRRHLRTAGMYSYLNVHCQHVAECFTFCVIIYCPHSYTMPTCLSSSSCTYLLGLMFAFTDRHLSTFSAVSGAMLNATCYLLDLLCEPEPQCKWVVCYTSAGALCNMCKSLWLCLLG